MKTQTNNKKKPRIAPTQAEKQAFLADMHNKLVNVGEFKHYGTYYIKHVTSPMKRTVSVYIHGDCFEVLIDEGGKEGWFAQKHDYLPGSMKRIEEIL